MSVSLMNNTEHWQWLKKNVCCLSIGPTEKSLTDAEYVAIALGLFAVFVLAYLIIDACHKG